MDLIDFLGSYGAWSWIVGGLILLAIELMVPGGVFVWLGISAIATGLISLVLPLGWEWLWVIYGVLALGTVFGWLWWAKGRKALTDSPFLNRRAARFVGQEVVLHEAIQGGFGRVKLGDTVWRVAGPDLAAGKKVRIVGHEGTVLQVEAAAEG